MEATSVFARAVEMFAVGADVAMIFVLIALARAPTVEVCALVKQAVHDLFESKRRSATA